MSRYQWAPGMHAPKGVSAEDVKKSLDALAAPTPEFLLSASKRKTHVLHHDLWDEGDQVWAQRGRLERCRKIIGGVHEVVVVGGKDISIRTVEFVHHKDQGKWVSMDDIRKDPDLLECYGDEVSRLLDQASAKHAKFRELMRK